MMANAQRETATIHQFPVGGRAGNHTGLARTDTFKPSANNTAQTATVVCGDSWYHEEAVRDAAEQPRKN